MTRPSDPNGDVPIPTKGIPRTPDMSTPDVVIPVLEGVWTILVNDDAGLAAQLDQTHSVTILDLWRDVVEWVESISGDDPTRHVYADLDACRLAALEDTDEVRGDLTSTLAALPFVIQRYVTQEAVAAAALAQCLYETGRIEDRHREYWATQWVSMVGEHVIADRRTRSSAGGMP